IEVGDRDRHARARTLWQPDDCASDVRNTYGLADDGLYVRLGQAAGTRIWPSKISVGRKRAGDWTLNERSGIRTGDDAWRWRGLIDEGQRDSSNDHNSGRRQL